MSRDADATHINDYWAMDFMSDEHFFVVCRYVERNALRVGLFDCAEHWRWGSLWRWL
ncbi:hypothetical protein N9N28_15775 [Rubripirellula amarantea]|nr:hypothetical protein [Rubripirellula amarantea]